MEPGNGYAFSSESQIASIVADDFRCESGIPVKGLTWWGAYWDTTIGGNNYYPYRNSNGWGDPGATNPEKVAGFKITFYQDVEAGSSVPPWSRPGDQVGDTYYIDHAAVQVNQYGVINRDASTQTVFQYDVIFEVPFEQTMGNIYWLSIQAVVDNGGPVQWGWQESDDYWNSNAVQDFPGNPFSWDMLPGEDMAFELKPVPIPSSLLLLGAGIFGLAHLKKKRC
jgi:hypothetical protein